MLEAITTILIALNIQFNVINNDLQIPTDELKVLQSSSEFVEKIKDGSIHDLYIIHDDESKYDIIVVPPVDPVR